MLYLAETSILFVHWKQHCPWKAARTLQHGPLCIHPSRRPSVPPLFRPSAVSPVPHLFLFLQIPFFLLPSFSCASTLHSINKSTATEQPPPAAHERRRMGGGVVRFIVTLFGNVAKKKKKAIFLFLKHLERRNKVNLNKVVLVS